MKEGMFSIFGKKSLPEEPTEAEETTASKPVAAITPAIASTVAPYSSSRAHLQESLQRIHMLIQAQIVRWHWVISQHKPEQSWGMWKMTKAEVEAVLASAYMAADYLPPEIAAMVQGYWDKADRLARHIEHRCQQRAGGVTLRLERIQAVLGIEPEQQGIIQDVLLVCLLPEMNGRYRRLFGYLQDDLTHIQPTIALIQQILQPQLSQPEAVFSLFAAESPLLRHHLIYWSEADTYLPLPLRSLHLDERIVAFLLEEDVFERRLLTVMHKASSSIHPAELVLPDPQLQTLNGLAEVLPQQLPLTMLWLGAYGSGRLAAAQALCYALEWPLLLVDIAAALEAETPWPLLVQLCLREARLRQAAVYWAGCERLIDVANHSYQWQVLVTAVEQFEGLTILASQNSWLPADRFHTHPFLSLDFPMPNYEIRQQLWQKQLQKLEDNFDAPIADMLAGSFQLTAGQMKDAVATAKGLARRRQPNQPTLTVEDLFEGCRRQSSQKLVTMARRIKPRSLQKEDDPFVSLILPPSAKLPLYELLTRITHHHALYERLGFADRLTLGKGTIALFTGSSGTGKTMAAELLASARQTDLYKIDLAAVVSKYVGETEKNLNKVFEQAEDSNAILFFDEADALFGKRGEVKDAHDRWANLEVSFLLQRVEEYEGVVIMATNLRQNIDQAFLRRIPVIVEFPFPNDAARLQILQGMFPPGIDYPDEQALQRLAVQFELAGGSWKNIVIGAAFRALSETEGGRRPTITLSHLVMAIAREYQKLGKPITRGEFSEPFYHLVENVIF